jgi:hypothetical protein
MGGRQPADSMRGEYDCESQGTCTNVDLSTEKPGVDSSILSLGTTILNTK